MQGAQKLRSEAHLWVRRNDEVAAQRRRWTFYETIKISIAIYHKGRKMNRISKGRERQGGGGWGLEKKQGRRNLRVRRKDYRANFLSSRAHR